MQSKTFTLALGVTTLLVSACTHTSSVRDGNIVAMAQDGGETFMVGPKGDAMVKIKLTSEDTGGAYEVITEDHPAGFESEPHIHPVGAETFYVINGEYEYFFDDVQGTAGPGTVWHVPAGVVHVIRAKTQGRVLMIYSPPEIVDRTLALTSMSPEDMAVPGAVAAKLSEYGHVSVDPDWIKGR